MLVLRKSFHLFLSLHQIITFYFMVMFISKCDI